MFGIDSSEFLLVALVALVVIGPKDLPKAMRLFGYWVGKARGVARQFRSGFDSMVREAELEEMEKRWATENERIMREHATSPVDVPDAHTDVSAAPIMVERPIVAAAPDETTAIAGDKAAS
jgi:sec-independent protein translocase protein TatB